MLLGLLLTEPAQAHVDVQPRLVQLGTATDLRIELPQLRAGAPPERLEVEGEGVTVLASKLEEVIGAETRWNVRLRVSPTVRPGEQLLVLRGLFADGESVEVDGTIVVVPAPEEEGASGAFPWVGSHRWRDDRPCPRRLRAPPRAPPERVVASRPRALPAVPGRRSRVRVVPGR